MADITVPLKVTARQAYDKAVQADCRARAVEESTNDFINGSSSDVNSVGAKTMLHQLSKEVKTIGDKIDSTNRYIVTLIVTICGGVILYLITNLIPKIIAIVGVVK
jgi:hypothetical protein